MGESWDCQQVFSNSEKEKFIKEHMPDSPLDSHMAGGYDEYNKKRKAWEAIWDLTESIRR